MFEPATVRPFAWTSGPNDIAIANSTIRENAAAGDRPQSATATRVRPDAVRSVRLVTAPAKSARERLVTLRPGNRIDQPSKSATMRIANTAPIRCRATLATPCRATLAGSPSPVAKDRATAIDASATIVNPGNSSPSAFGQVCAIGPQKRRFGSAVKYA